MKKIRSIWSFLKQLTKRIVEDDLWGMAAQLAFFFLLSLFPFMLFLVTLLGFLPVTQDDLINFLSVYAPDQTISLIGDTVSQVVEERNGGLLSLGILGTLWSASNGINSVIKSMNTAYNIEEKRSMIVTRLIAIALTIFMLFVIIIAFLLPVFGQRIGEYLFSFIGLSEDFLVVWNAMRWGISSIIIFLVLLALYRMAPSRRVYFADAAVGAIVATILWQIVSLTFSFYVNSAGNFSATYGSLGGVIILMLWFYLSGMIIIFGGEVNALIELRRKKYRH